VIGDEQGAEGGERGHDSGGHPFYAWRGGDWGGPVSGTGRCQV
jgi:hypothetical protein